MEYIRGVEDEQRVKQYILGYIERNGGMPDFLMLNDVRSVAQRLVGEGVLATERMPKRHNGVGYEFIRYVRVGGE